MGKTIFFVVVAALGGWLYGSHNPGSAAWADRAVSFVVNQEVVQSLGIFSSEEGSVDEPSAEEGETTDEAADETAASSDSGAPVEGAVAPVRPELAPAHLQHQAFADALYICGGMDVSNAPPTDGDLRVTTYSPMVSVDGVAIALYPVTGGACLSSGYGDRDGRPHSGIDYYSEEGGSILAGGDGVVREMKYRDDFGNMVLIDHGNGVFTRYAHLASFAPGLGEGVGVRAGDVIGEMGNTAGYTIPVHLHYELLTGNYQTRARSFGLDTQDPFAYAS
jgi:murein DD-endopeptidase MepM/ murein hydrolase activator NlpD